MKRPFLALCLVILFSSCSPESSPATEEIPEALNVEVNASTLSPNVDEMLSVQVETNIPLEEIMWIREGITRSYSTLGNGQINNPELYFQFPEPGRYPVELEFRGTNGAIVKKQLSFDVQRGNTVQISKLEINNYYDKGNTWDPEFDQNDENRLADLIFSLEKPQHFSIIKKELSLSTWFVSDIHKNESSFTWDLTNEQLFLNPLYTFYFGLADADEDNVMQNIMLDYPSRPVDLRPYIENKPASIVFEVPSIGLAVTFHLDWP